MATPEEIRRAREATAYGGIFNNFFATNRAYRNRLAQQGRRPVLGGLLSKEPVMGTDTLRYEGIRPFIGNLLEPVIKGVDAPRAASQDLIPQEDIVSEALGTAGTAMLGGGAVAKPAGSLGAFYGREGGSIQDALELARSGRGIFHSSQADQFDEINKYGVEPQYGPWVKEVAEGATDDPSFLDDMPMAAWWSEQPNWVKMKTARAAGKNVNDVTVDDIRKYGHLSIADADEYADTVYRIPEEGIEYEGSEVSNLSGERMPLYATDLYEYGEDGVGRYPFGIESNELVTRESVEPKYSLTGQELVDFLKQYDGNKVSANRSKSAGILATIGDNGGPPLDKPLTKEQLDPLGYQKTKMRRPFSEVEVQQRDLGENLARKPMSWEDMEGQVILPFYGDRTSRGLLVEGVNDYKFDAPVYTEGGVDFKVGPAAQKDRAIWASNQNIITRLSKEADKAQRDFGGRDILGVTGSMAPDANDFATFTGEAVAELVKGSKITKKTAKEFDKTMKALDPTFVGLLSPDLRDWVKNTSSPNRKSFIRLMDSRPMQDAGLPSPAEARKSVTDPTQYELPAGMFGLGVSRIDTGAPLMFNTPKGNKPAANVPHSTYNTQITGDYLGSLQPVPQRLIFKDVYDAISGNLDKRGNPLTEANMTHAIKTKMPAQELTPQIIDGILNYLARQER